MEELQFTGEEYTGKEFIPSSDLRLRLQRQSTIPFSKVEMNRKIIHQLVRDRLKLIINTILDRVIDSGNSVGRLDYLGDDYLQELVKAFVPFMDICSLCKLDGKCSIQGMIKEGTHRLYNRLQQSHSDIEVSPSYTIVKCGIFDLVDIHKILR